MANNKFEGGRIHLILATCIFVSTLMVNEVSFAQTIYQIWSPRSSSTAGQSATNECFFRKKFTLIQPELAQVQLAATDEYELYLNGRLVKKGDSYNNQQYLDVSEYLEPGVNLIAARIRQLKPGDPAFALKFRTKEKNETRWRSLTTDNTWKTRMREMPNWYHNSYNDIGWLGANKISTVSFAKKTQQSVASANSQIQVPSQPSTVNSKGPRYVSPSLTAPSQEPQVATTERSGERRLIELDSRDERQEEIQTPTTAGQAPNVPTYNMPAPNAPLDTTIASAADSYGNNPFNESPWSATEPSDADLSQARETDQSLTRETDQSLTRDTDAMLVGSPQTSAPVINQAATLEPQTLETQTPDGAFDDEIGFAGDDLNNSNGSNELDGSDIMDSPTMSAADQFGGQTSGDVSVDQTRQTELVDTGRFKIDPEFTIQQVLLEEESGSVLAMAFNEFGNLIVSKERGPLVIVDLTKPAGGERPRTRVLCSQVNSCQGILPLNGDVFVTGQGPDGQALYRLSDPNRDGTLEVSETILRFKGPMGEHGAHGVELGPDGMLYVALGNATSIETKPAATSPYKNTYEGDLVSRYEDPGGHAAGIKAPGGTIVRVALDGSVVQTVCGGIRNTYDLVFNSQGELFCHDSDMESNIGHAWYRPTRIYHVADGAEFGWRSGWSKFPNYFADVMEPAATTGRGSPTGAVLYQHMQFPSRYHNTMFMADWSEGRILAIKETPNGAGYQATPEVFVSGKPLNVTDLAVGEDGTLYFATGGRGTTGGVYRVVWKGKIPDHMLSFKNDLERVIRHPQPQSAWARQNTALIKKKLQGQWKTSLMGVAKETRNDPQYRIRALDTMVFYGPFPNRSLITELSRDQNAAIRSKAAKLAGIKNRPELKDTLFDLLTDESPLVRRHAAESCIRTNTLPSASMLRQMLSSVDKAEALPARRLLERIPTGQWRQEILDSQETRVFINGSLALMTAEPTIENAYDVLARTSDLMDGFVSDTDFVDLLRVIQISIAQGKVDPKQVPAFVQKLGNEFPSGNGIINRQLAMVLAYLKPATFDGRVKEYFESHPDAAEDKLYVAMHLQKIGSSLEGDSFAALIDTLEQSRTRMGGTAYRSYISRAITELSQTANDKQVQSILENGSRWPNALITSFFRLPEQLTPQQIDLVIKADREIEEPENEDLTIRRMRMGAIAVLAQTGGEKSYDYLREIWRTREKYRNHIALGLAQEPTGKNWAYLVSTIPVLDDLTGKDVLLALAKVKRRPSQPGPYRNVIELGYRLRKSGAMHASKLLTHWTGEEPKTSITTNVSWKQSMDFWSNWFERTWEDEAPIERGENMRFGKFDSAQVLAYLERGNAGNPQHGAEVFSKAQCATCHKIGSTGASIGPDLTNLAFRFSKREILESIVHPSNVISDQYKSKKILTLDGNQYIGMIVRDGPDSIVVLDETGATTRLNLADVDGVKETETSAMPEGLLDGLSMDEIASLFSFMTGESGERSAQATQESTETVR